MKVLYGYSRDRLYSSNHELGTTQDVKFGATRDTSIDRYPDSIATDIGGDADEGDYDGNGVGDSTFDTLEKSVHDGNLGNTAKRKVLVHEAIVLAVAIVFPSARTEYHSI